MKTRIIKTKIWTDSKFLSVSPNARYLLIFLISCPYVGMSNYFECPDIFIISHTGMKTLDTIKGELTIQKIAYFYEGWVFIPNLEKHNKYKNSPRNENAYKEEISSIPEGVVKYFDSTIDSSMHSTIHSSHKSKIKNHKSKTINNKSKIENISLEEKQRIADKYSVPLSFVNSKQDDMLNWHEKNPAKNVYKNYVAALRDWVKRDALKITQDHHDKQISQNKYGVTKV